MDPLSAVLLTVNFIAVVDNLYRGIKFVREIAQDPKADGLYVRLITEKARYAEWKRRMGIENSEDIQNLMNILPLDARESLPSILFPLAKYVELAEKLFKRYGITSPHIADKQRSFKDKLRRVDLLLDGQRQLDDLLKTLKDCNDGLLTIVPPAPGYYVSLAGNDQILETSPESHDLRLEALQRQRGSLPQSLQSLQSPTQSSHAEFERGQNPAPDPAIANQEKAPKTFCPVIELLYSTCLGVLRAMVVKYPIHQDDFSGLASRLAGWGTGLFQGSVTIDQALNTDSRGVTFLKRNISGTLSDIAVVLSKLVTLRNHVCVIVAA